MEKKELSIKELLNRKYIIASAVFSTFFTILLVLGGVIYDRDSFPTWQMLKESGKNFLLSPFILIAVFILTYLTFMLLKKEVKEISFLPRFLCNPFFPAIILILFYGVVYLSYYPGTWCYDIIQQNQMVLGLEKFTKHHPPLHTYLWGLCRLIENLSGGRIWAIVFYSIIQIVASSLVFGKVVDSIRKVTKNDICSLLALFYFIVNPTFALFSFSPTKDPWCMIFFLLAMTYLYEELFELKGEEKDTKKSIKHDIRIIVFLLLSCLFRNNMIHALILFGVIALVLFRNKWKKILVYGATVLISFLIINSGVYPLLGISNVDKKEFLSVPIQQIGRAYRDYSDTFTQKEIDDIDKYIGLDRIPYYNAHLSDYLKNKFKNEEFEKDKKSFVSLWISLGRKHPDSYVIAYLSQYCPYWYFRSKSYDIISGSPYVEDNISTDNDFAFERAGFLTDVYSFYHKIASKSDSVLIYRGWPFWISVTALFFSIVRKRKKEMIIPMLCACYMMTLFLGPLCIIRYALPILGTAPIIAVSFLNIKK